MSPMASKAPVADSIGSHWTDQEIFSCLHKITDGSAVPDYVIVDNPYQYDPSNLPDGAWFLVRLTDEKETKHGMWLAKGEASLVFSNSDIFGWRTTYEFQAPTKQKTVWMMQEYKVTKKIKHDRNETKLKDSALCRVFSCCDEKSNSETKPDYEIEAQVKNQTEVSLGNKFDDPSGDDIVAELKAELEADVECFMDGDYLELNDLVDATSHSSSSENSSPRSLISDEWSGPIANDVVIMQPAPLESLVKDSGVDTQEVAADESSSKPSPEHAVKRMKADEGPSSSYRAASSRRSSSGGERGARREEKRMDKLKRYFCFMML